MLTVDYTPACNFRHDSYCTACINDFGKPVFVTNGWCNGECKNHNGPYNNRTLSKTHRDLFVVKMFFRTYVGGSRTFLDRVLNNFKRDMLIDPNYELLSKLKKEITKFGYDCLFTGSLLLKQTEHKDYDIVILVANVSDIVELKQNLPKTLFGVNVDYFFLTSKRTSFFAITFDLDTKTLYLSPWFRPKNIKYGADVSIVTCVYEGLDNLLQTFVFDKNITAHNIATYAEAILTGEHVSTEVEKARISVCASCEFSAADTTGKSVCKLCGCQLHGKTALPSLKERLPKWGCKHPKRDLGFGWQS